MENESFMEHESYYLSRLVDGDKKRPLISFFIDIINPCACTLTSM